MPPTVQVQNVWPPRALVTVTGLAGGENVKLYRTAAGVQTLVRGGSWTSAPIGAALALDAEVPFGIPITYSSVINGVSSSASPVTITLPGGRVAITDAINGLAAEVTILSWPEKVYDRPGTVFQLANGKAAVVSGPVTQFTGTAELFVEQTSSLTNLISVLSNATGGLVQVRQPGGYDGVDSYVVVRGFNVRRYSQDGSDQRRTVRLELTEVPPWADTLRALGYTYAQVAAYYGTTTYAAATDDFATYLAAAQGSYD